jgi:hypothetical protein
VPRTARARSMPVKVKAGLIAAVLVLPVWWGVATYHRITLQNRLSPIASEIAGRKVGVHCPGWLGRIMAPGDTTAGVVSVDADGRVADRTDLRTRTCDELAAVIGGAREQQLACAARSTSCGDDVQAMAWAINTLAHEAIHLRGILDEGVTECYAVQNFALVAQRLGVTPEQARNLAITHWETSREKLPDRYLATGCENGGPLDLRPADPVWP